MKRAALLLLTSSCSSGLVVQTVSEYGGTAISGVQVKVGNSAWIATDEDGEAHFEDPPEEYTVLVHQHATSGDRYVADKIWSLIGGDEDPMIVEVDGSFLTLHRGQITGSITGFASANNTKIITAASRGYTGQGEFTGSNSFSAEVRWEGEATKEATVHAVEVDTFAQPLSFSAYGKASVELTDAGEATVDVHLKPIQQKLVRAQLSASDGFAPALLASISLELEDGTELFFEQAPLIGQGSEITTAMPEIDGATAFLNLKTLDNPGTYVRQNLSDAEALQVKIASPVELMAPAENAPFDVNTNFSWSISPEPGRYSLSMNCGWTAGDGVEHSVFYRDVESELPTALFPIIPGVSIGPGVTCQWRVRQKIEGDGFVSYTVSAERAIRVP